MEEQNKKKSVFFSKKWRYRILAAICVLIVAIPLVGVLAKYITTMTVDDTVTAALFVVDGDYAQEIKNDGDTVPEIEVSGWATYGIVLKLYNHNAEKTSKVDMTYSYTAKRWDSTTNAYAEEWAGASAEALPKDTNSNATIMLALPETAQKGDKIEFTLTTAPYAVTIKATFVLTDSKTPYWELEDKGVYTLLTIHGSDYAGKIIVNYNGTIFAPDSTNKLMEAWNRAENTGSFTAERFTTYELRFFEEVYAEYTYASSTGSLGEEGYTITITTP